MFSKTRILNGFNYFLEENHKGIWDLIVLYIGPLRSCWKFYPMRGNAPFLLILSYFFLFFALLSGASVKSIFFPNFLTHNEFYQYFIGRYSFKKLSLFNYHFSSSRNSLQVNGRTGLSRQIARPIPRMHIWFTIHVYSLAKYLQVKN